MNSETDLNNRNIPLYVHFRDLNKIDFVIPPWFPIVINQPK